MKNRAVMLFCFSSSFPFLRNLQPLLNGNGKFRKWRGERRGVGWAAVRLSLTSPIWTGEGRGRLASLQATPNPSQLLAVQGQRLFSPQVCVFGGLEKAFFFHKQLPYSPPAADPMAPVPEQSSGSGRRGMVFI